MTQIVYAKDASARTGLAVGTLRNMRSRGAGPISFIHNGKIAYRVSDLKQWMADREAATLRGGAN